MVTFPESRILGWAFIDHGCPESLGPTSPDLLHVHGSLKTKLFVKPTLAKCCAGTQGYTCQLDVLSLSRTPISKNLPITSFKGENFFHNYLPVVRLRRIKNISLNKSENLSLFETLRARVQTEHILVGAGHVPGREAGLVHTVPGKPGLPPGVLLTAGGGHYLLSSPSDRVSVL